MFLFYLLVSNSAGLKSLFLKNFPGMQALTHLSERLYQLGTSRILYQTQISLSLLQEQLPEFFFVWFHIAPMQHLLDLHTFH